MGPRISPSAGHARVTLTRGQIASAALELIDEDGLEACSMRRLGSRLGVEAMALYHHFPSKGVLLDAVIDHLLDEIPSPELSDPFERLRQLMRNFREIAIRHPRAFVLLATRRFNTEHAFNWYETVLSAFAELGLNAADTARWFRLIGGYVCGEGLSEVASRELVPDATALRLQSAPEELPYSHVRAAAPHLKVDKLEGAFEFSLTILFDALARYVAVHGTAGRAAPAANG
ncbi:MAG TPA: TetR family transcriptional regulator [Aliidongia sp.]|nr:TetR family transcriptional regulator [Aliidongia sp.]